MVGDSASDTVILVSFIIYSYVYLQLNAESDGDTDVNSVCVSDSVPSFWDLNLI